MLEFSHVGLVVTDLERSIRFYRDVVGLKVLEHYPDSGNGIDIAFVGSDTPAIELLCYTDPDKRRRPERGRYDHFAWYVPDIEQKVAELKQKGVQFVPDEIRSALDGRRIAFFHGPDGERIELVQAAKR
ncbi:MAG: VOC family protein [Bacillota bacterium]